MKTAKELLQDSVSSISLNILVFGPQVKKLSVDERLRNLQQKRMDIREALEDQGHFVKYAEDIVDPELPQPVNNAFLQEIVIMAEYDFIVTLVESPGSIVEAALIATKPDLAKKASLFLDEDYSEGLTADTCRNAETLGADFNTFKYPDDLVECNLLGFVRKRVEIVQLIKYLS